MGVSETTIPWQASCTASPSCAVTQRALPQHGTGTTENYQYLVFKYQISSGTCLVLLHTALELHLKKYFTVNGIRNKNATTPRQLIFFPHYEALAFKHYKEWCSNTQTNRNRYFG